MRLQHTTAAVADLVLVCCSFLVGCLLLSSELSTLQNTQDPKPCPQLAALAIMLDRPHLAADPRLLCSTARVCTSWRAAVAASGCSSSTDVVLRFNNPSRMAAAAVVAVQVGCCKLWSASRQVEGVVGLAC